MAGRLENDLWRHRGALYLCRAWLSPCCRSELACKCRQVKIPSLRVCDHEVCDVLDVTRRLEHDLWRHCWALYLCRAWLSPCCRSELACKCRQVSACPSLRVCDHEICDVLDVTRRLEHDLWRHCWALYLCRACLSQCCIHEGTWNSYCHDWRDFGAQDRVRMWLISKDFGPYTCPRRRQQDGNCARLNNEATLAAGSKSTRLITQGPPPAYSRAAHSADAETA